MTGLQPRRIGLLGLLALLPLAAYQLSVPSAGFAPLLAAVCVLLIVGSLLVMFSPVDGPSPSAPR